MGNRSHSLKLKVKIPVNRYSRILYIYLRYMYYGIMYLYVMSLTIDTYGALNCLFTTNVQTSDETQIYKPTETGPLGLWALAVWRLFKRPLFLAATPLSVKKRRRARARSAGGALLNIGSIYRI